MFQKWVWLNSKTYRIGRYLFGCTCSGPCDHAWVANIWWLTPITSSNTFYRFSYFLWHRVLGLGYPEFEG